jgi:hypothetical protein
MAREYRVMSALQKHRRAGPQDVRAVPGRDLYLKKAKADQIAFGTASAHRARLAGLVDLPAPAEGG